MNPTQMAAVKELLQEIELEQKMHEIHMEKRRQELMAFVPYFDDYREMYSFIKKNTPNLEAFCRDINEALPIFWKSKE